MIFRMSDAEMLLVAMISQLSLYYTILLSWSQTWRIASGPSVFSYKVKNVIALNTRFIQKEIE